MQTSLHWSVKRASFSLLLIIEFTSCSLEDKWRITTNRGQKPTERQEERMSGSVDNVMVDGKEVKRDEVVQNWARLLINKKVSTCRNGHFSSHVEDTGSSTTHSPDNVHVSVSIAHVQPQQGRDVIRRRGRPHVPSDDVQPVGNGCSFINSHHRQTSSYRPGVRQRNPLTTRTTTSQLYASVNQSACTLHPCLYKRPSLCIDVWPKTCSLWA